MKVCVIETFNVTFDSGAFHYLMSKLAGVLTRSFKDTRHFTFFAMENL